MPLICGLVNLLLSNSIVSDCSNISCTLHKYKSIFEYVFASSFLYFSTENSHLSQEYNQPLFDEGIVKHNPLIHKKTDHAWHDL